MKEKFDSNTIQDLISDLNEFGNYEIRFYASQILFSFLWKNSKNLEIVSNSKSCLSLIDSIFNLILDLNFETKKIQDELEKKKQITYSIELMRTFLNLSFVEMINQEYIIKQIFLFNKNFDKFLFSQQELTSCLKLKFYLKKSLKKFLLFKEKYLKIGLIPLKLNKFQLNLLNDKKKSTESMKYICKMNYSNGIDKESIAYLSMIFLKNNNSILMNQRVLECLFNYNNLNDTLDTEIIKEVFRKSLSRLAKSENSYYIIWTILLLKKLILENFDDTFVDNDLLEIFENILHLNRVLLVEDSVFSLDTSFKICFEILNVLNHLSSFPQFLKFFNEGNLIELLSSFLEKQNLNNIILYIFGHFVSEEPLKNDILKKIIHTKMWNVTISQIFWYSNDNLEVEDLQLILSQLKPNDLEDSDLLNLLAILLKNVQFINEIENIKKIQSIIVGRSNFILEFYFKILSLSKCSEISIDFLIESILYFRFTTNENYDKILLLANENPKILFLLTPSILERLENEKNEMIIAWILRTIRELSDKEECKFIVLGGNSIQNKLDIDEILSMQKFMLIQNSYIKNLIAEISQSYEKLKKTYSNEVDKYTSPFISKLYSEEINTNSIFCSNLICRKVLSLDTIFRCSKCKLIYYCSKRCQISDWSFHKCHCEMDHD
eukprot:gene3061-5231_t